jgi:hypothetical protein
MPKLPAGVRGFHELLDILLPKRNGLAVILKAFFDASARPQSGVFCVAGFAFRKLQLQKFDRDWWRLFGKYGGCHMKELTQLRGRFVGIDRAEADRLTKQAVAIMCQRTLYGVAVSCYLQEMNALLPKWIRGFEHAYPVCCHQAMVLLAIHMNKFGSDDQVAYTFETGDLYAGSAHQFMERASADPSLRKALRHNSHTFANNDDVLALQAADMWAWEFAKYIDETAGQRKRVMRKSLAALLRGRNSNLDRDRFIFNHLTGDHLQALMHEARRLGLMQRAEDAARKNRSSGEHA